MLNYIVKIFRGVFTNADSEDLPPEFCAEQKNLRSRNGRLVKTFGFGNKIAHLLANTIDNLTTYVHDSFTTPADKLYIGYYVNNSTYAVTLYGHNNSAWVAIGSITLITWKGTSYYHRNDKNPIVHIDQDIRFLPGNVSKPDGSNVAKGIWLGYIDRSHFDSLYTIAAGFYDEATTIDAPDPKNFEFLLNANGVSGDFTDGNTIYYRFSYVYDGNQESLLPDSGIEQVMPSTIDAVPNIKWTVAEAGINNRITAVRVYRSDNVPSGPYYHIATVDYLRKGADLSSGTTGSANGATNMMKKVFIPSLSNVTPSGNPGRKIKVGASATFDINESVNAPGFDYLILTSDTYGATSHFNQSWTLYESNGSTIVASGTEGAYAGYQSVYINQDLSDKNFVGGIALIDKANLGYQGQIINQMNSLVDAAVKGTAFRLSFNQASDYTNKNWEAVTPREGNFFVEESGTTPARTWAISFWDTALLDKTEHYLIGEPSIEINGEFAKAISGRLWQQALVLDPADAAEVRGSWYSYSELWKYDVNPNSNVRRLIDREGGDGTGIQEVFGNPVFLMRQAIVTLFGVKSNPGNDVAWHEVTSTHNIGNIAKHGSIVVRDSLYVVYYDGMYRLRPNNLAETDQTPLELLRFTEPIGDTFDALTLSQKEAIKCEYSQETSEIIYTLGSKEWAFNIDENDWRQIVSAATADLKTLDENANVLIYQDSDKKLYSTEISEAVTIGYKTKTFPVSEKRGEPVRKVFLTYKSASALTLNVYLNNSGSAAITKTIPINTTISTYEVGIKCMARKIAIEILDSAASSTDTEIHKIHIV